MSRRTVGFILLLVASLCVGVFSGEKFYGLFLSSVPPMSQSALSISTAHGAFLTYGFVLGIVLCLWGLLAAVLARFFRNERPAETSGGRPGAAKG